MSWGCAIKEQTFVIMCLLHPSLIISNHGMRSHTQHTHTLTSITQALSHTSPKHSHPHHTCALTHPVLPFSKEVGCYVDEEDKHAFMFSQEGKLTFVSGDQASTQATVSLDHVLCRIQVAGVGSDHVCKVIILHPVFLLL